MGWIRQGRGIISPLYICTRHRSGIVFLSVLGEQAGYLITALGSEKFQSKFGNC